jgi:hypothetical protein
MGENSPNLVTLYADNRVAGWVCKKWPKTYLCHIKLMHYFYGGKK